MCEKKHKNNFIKCIEQKNIDGLVNRKDHFQKKCVYIKSLKSRRKFRVILSGVRLVEQRRHLFYLSLGVFFSYQG